MSNGTGPFFPVIHWAADDQGQSSGRATRPRRTGLRCMYPIFSATSAVRREGQAVGIPFHVPRPTMDASLSHAGEDTAGSKTMQEKRSLHPWRGRGPGSPWLLRFAAHTTEPFAQPTTPPALLRDKERDVISQRHSDLHNTT